MKRATKIFGTGIAVVSAILQFPGVTDAIRVLLAAHPHALLSTIGALLLGALLHDPKKA